MTELAALPRVERFASLGDAYLARVPTTPVRTPRLLHWNADAAALVGLPADPSEIEGIVDILSGNAPWPGVAPYASVYSGHQFGSYVPQLGDGRALTIAELQGPQGSWELQLKGAGRTPFSRFGDGRAVLRSTIREYLGSEAMHALGIPTTRALSLVSADDAVRREMLESAAVLCRMAPSHVRFGHFEYFYYTGRHERLAPLADHIIDHHYPEFSGLEDRYARWLSRVIERTAQLIAQWQAVGFCHGVMNTDNMSILGLTIDYGPYGFLDGFDPHHICNHTDETGRYAYDRQSGVAHWNLSRLIQACLPLLGEDENAAVELANALLNAYPPAFTGAMLSRWRAKLGLTLELEPDRELVNQFLNLLDAGHSDFTRSFRMLSELGREPGPTPRLRDHLHDPAGFDAWLATYRQRLRMEPVDESARRIAMDAVNPKYVLRNHLLQRAIVQAQDGDAGEVQRLFEIMRRPFDEQPEFEAYAEEPPADERHIAVSCSS
jgi:uncharacterized protein YdiU (UPF0061 family)